LAGAAWGRRPEERAPAEGEGGQGSSGGPGWGARPLRGDSAAAVCPVLTGRGRRGSCEGGRKPAAEFGATFAGGRVCFVCLLCKSAALSILIFFLGIPPSECSFHVQSGRRVLPGSGFQKLGCEVPGSWSLFVPLRPSEECADTCGALQPWMQRCSCVKGKQ
jgi:hypothetical protein